MKIHPSAVAITAALIVASVLLAPSRAHACTLYAAAGTAVDDGGVMISKVRDWRPSEETFVRVTPKSGEGYAYVGLATGKYQNFNMGVNEKGLALGLDPEERAPRDAAFQVEGRLHVSRVPAPALRDRGRGDTSD